MDAELTYRQCLAVLRSGHVGRVAFCSPAGPEIVPLNYALVDEAVIFRTSPYSLLGTHGREARMAFEVDQVHPESRSAVSVVVHGRCTTIDDTAERDLVRLFHDPDPWARGSRWLHLKLPLTSLTGRRIGPGGLPARHLLDSSS